MSTTRWGIIGTGGIAKQFAHGLKELPVAQLVAVGSRTQAGAEAFGAEFGVPRRYGTYAELAHDPEIDAVYIATPHPSHYPDTLLCLEHNKAVLCEKPFTVNAAQTERLIAVARERRLFLMEAMWTRFIPAIVRLRELIQAGTIGDLQALQIDCGFRATFDPKHRMFDPAAGGGALLDIGIYPVSLCSMLLGTPVAIAAQMEFGSTGVDEQTGIILRYPHGQIASLLTTVRATTPSQAHIIGSQGSIVFGPPLWRPDTLTITRPNRAPEILNVPYAGNGYQYEALEVMTCLAEGKLESAIMPLAESLAIMQTLDTIRAQCNLRYPDAAEQL